MDVFLSYSRDNSGLCDELYALLISMGLSVFLDRHVPAGVPWETELRKQLAAQQRPTVVLVATREAVARPVWIRREIELARQHDLTIVPVEFTPGAAAQLLGDDRLQYFPAAGVDSDLERALRVALLGRRLELALERRLAETQAWCDALAQPRGFRQAVRRALAARLEASGGLALLGPGGAGKSTLAALLAQDVAQGGTAPDGRHERAFPILLVEADLCDGGAALARDLGAHGPDELQQHLERCRRHHGLRVVFVLDGLDQMVPQAGAGFDLYARSLRRLGDAASLLVTCRPEVWNETYRRVVSLSTEAMDDLSPEAVRAAWMERFGAPRDPLPPILGRPLFLDFALREAGGWDTLPQTDVGFLRHFRRSALGAARGHAVGRGVEPERLLSVLGAMQVEQARFAIARDAIEQRLGSPGDAMLTTLLERRVLRSVPGASPAVHFTHDVLDAFNMAWTLLAAQSAERAAFFSRMDADGMWPVVGLLAALADEFGQPRVVRDVFEYFLGVLDRKAHSPQWMNQAWGATYALQERFAVFLPLILECFGTDDIAPSLAPGAASGGSRLGPPPALTQEAASTLASAFQALRGGTRDDAARAVPALVGKLQTWQKRFRIVEALAKFPCAPAREALIAFARERLARRDDDPVFETTLHELGAFDHADVAVLLDEVAECDRLPRRLRRAARASLARMRPVAAELLTRTDDDLIEDLRPFDTGRDGCETTTYSDWRRVEAAALELRERIARGTPPSAPVTDALVRALRHDQSAVRAPVAECLGGIAGVPAADALIAELCRPDIPGRVREACAESLRRQTAHAGGMGRQAMRVALLRGARDAARVGAALGAQALRDVALDPVWANEPLLDAGGALLGPLPAAGTGHVCVCVSAEWPVDPAVAAIVPPEYVASAGPEHESKCRIAGVASDGTTLELTIAPSTWALSRAFHRLAVETPERIPRANAGAWLLPPPLGSAQLPGLAVVHALVTTADGMLLTSQRSEHVSYAPLHWSLSFEEQMTADADGAHESPVAAALRGFHEEFGIRCAANEADVLGALLELDNLNVAVLVHLRCAATAAEIRRTWLTPPRPSHHHEAVEVGALPATAGPLAALLRGESPLAPLHPTSRLRVRALLARLRPLTDGATPAAQ